MERKCEKCGASLYFAAGFIEAVINTGSDMEISLQCANQECDATYSYWIPNTAWTLQNPD